MILVIKTVLREHKVLGILSCSKSCMRTDTERKNWGRNLKLKNLRKSHFLIHKRQWVMLMTVFPWYYSQSLYTTHMLRLHVCVFIVHTHILHLCILISMINACRHMHTYLHIMREWSPMLFLRRQISILKVVSRFCFYCDNWIWLWGRNLPLFVYFLWGGVVNAIKFPKSRCFWQISLQKSKLDTKAMVYPGKFEFVFLLNCLFTAMFLTATGQFLWSNWSH